MVLLKLLTWENLNLNLKNIKDVGNAVLQQDHV